MRRDRTDDLIAHLVEQIVVGDVARTDQLDPGLVEPAFDELTHEGGARADGTKMKMASGFASAAR